MSIVIQTSLLSFLFLSASALNAAQITYEFSGSITSAVDYSGEAIKVTDTYVASFDFDSTTTDLDPDPQIGLYRSLSSSVVVGQQTFSGVQDSGLLRVIDDPSGDRLTVWCSSSSSSDIATAHFEADLRDQTATAFSAATLPLPATDLHLSAFQNVFFSVVRTNGPGKLGGTVIAFEIVPEPYAAFIFLFGSIPACRRSRS